MTPTPPARAPRPPVLAAFLPALLLPTSTVRAASYTVKELKPLAGGNMTDGRAINAAGHAVGASTDKLPLPWATRWNVPGTTPTVWWGFGDDDFFHSVNATDDEVGQALVHTLTVSESYPLLQTGSNLFTLATPGYSYGVAYCIADRFADPSFIDTNSIVGAVANALGADPEERAVAWTGNGVMTVLDPLPGGELGTWNVAYSIDAFGLIGGSSNGKGAIAEQAVVWGPAGSSITTWYNDPARDNPGVGGGVRDVSDSYYFAGYYYPGPTPPLVEHACYWDGTPTTHDIGTLYGGNSMALGVRNHAFTANQRPVIVGWSDKDKSSNGHFQVAFIWDEVHNMRDLNALIPANTGWVLDIAYGVTPDGRIVGSGELGGQPRGFVLVPYTILKLAFGNRGLIVGGQSAQASLEMSDAAPEDTTIALRSSSPYAVVPATVTIPRGRSSVGFSIGTRPVRGPLDAVISAVRDDDQMTATIRITP